MRTMIGLLVLALLVAGCGSQPPSEGAIQTAIALTQEPQASTSPHPTVQAAQDTPAVTEATPTTGTDQLDAAPSAAILEPAQPAESLEPQLQPGVPSLVLSTPASTYATSGGKILIESGGNQTKAFDIKTGESMWAADASGKILGADPDLVYIQPADLRVDALDTETGEFRWRLLSEEPVIPETANENAILFRSQSQIYVVDKSSGNLVSSTPHSAREGESWQSRGKTVATSYWEFLGRPPVGELGSFSDTGELAWFIPDVGWRLFCDGMFVYGTSDESYGLEAIDVNTGSRLWKTDTVPVLSESSVVQQDLPATWSKNSMLSLNYLSVYEFARDDQWELCGAYNIYIPAGNSLQAVSKETGELRWRGLVSNAGFWGGGVYKDNNNWLGEAGGMVLYSHTGFGWTQAYDAIDHTLLWENPQVVLEQIIAFSEDTMVGFLWEPQASWNDKPGIIVGLDPKTGTQLWRSEPGAIRSIHLMQERLFYVLAGKSVISFIDPRSGQLIVEIPFNEHSHTDWFASPDGMIVAEGDELVVIRP